MISENALCTVYREPVWCRESLQRRKAFEKLLPVSSPPPHCTFSPLTPSFHFHYLSIPGDAYEVTVLPGWAARLCGLMILWGTSAPFWGHPFLLLHTGNPLIERHCAWFGGWLHGNFTVFRCVEGTCCAVSSQNWQVKIEFKPESSVTVDQNKASVLYCHVNGDSRNLPRCVKQTAADKSTRSNCRPPNRLSQWIVCRIILLSDSK